MATEPHSHARTHTDTHNHANITPEINKNQTIHTRNIEKSSRIHIPTYWNITFRRYVFDIVEIITQNFLIGLHNIDYSKTVKVHTKLRIRRATFQLKTKCFRV